MANNIDSYNKVRWVNDITPLNAENMNNMDIAIDLNRQYIKSHEDSIETIRQHIDNKNNPHEVKADQVDYNGGTVDGSKVDSALNKHRTELNDHNTRINTNKKNLDTEIVNRKNEDTRILNEAKTYTDTELDGIIISIEKENSKDHIILKDKDGNKLSSTDASVFVKDGMLSNATYNTSTKKLTLTWNTDGGNSSTELDLNDLVDTYTGGNGINVSNDGTVSIDNNVVATQENLNTLDSTLRSLIGNSGGNSGGNNINTISQYSVNVWELDTGAYIRTDGDIYLRLDNETKNSTTQVGTDFIIIKPNTPFYINKQSDKLWYFYIYPMYSMISDDGTTLMVDDKDRIIWGKVQTSDNVTYKCDIFASMTQKDVINNFSASDYENNKHKLVSASYIKEYTDSNITKDLHLKNIVWSAMDGLPINTKLSGKFIRLCVVPQESVWDDDDGYITLPTYITCMIAPAYPSSMYGALYWIDVPISESVTNWKLTNQTDTQYLYDTNNNRHTINLKYSFEYDDKTGEFNYEALIKCSDLYGDTEYHNLKLLLIYDGSGSDKIYTSRITGPCDMFKGSREKNTAWEKNTVARLINSFFYNNFNIHIDTPQGQYTVIAAKARNDDNLTTYANNLTNITTGSTLELSPLIRNDAGNQTRYVTVGVSDTVDGDITTLLVAAQFSSFGSFSYFNSDLVSFEANASKYYQITGNIDFSQQDTKTIVTNLTVKNTSTNQDAFIRYVKSYDQFNISGSGVCLSDNGDCCPVYINLISGDGEYYVFNKFVCDAVSVPYINKVIGFN